jgi:signal transduction histidine kinase
LNDPLDRSYLVNVPATESPTLLTLPLFDLQVPDTSLGSEVARLFQSDRSLPGVIVTRDGAFTGIVAANQLFQRLGRPFGIEIYSTRPIRVFLESLEYLPTLLPENTTIQGAIITCLARPADHVYDPLAIMLKDGSYRLIDFLTLILKQSDLLTAAQREAHAQGAAALAASTAKSDFLANMSHELRTPLTAIIGYGEILIEDLKSGETGESLRRLESIVKAGMHLLEMINGILDLSKIEAGKMDLTVTLFSLSGLITDASSIAQPLMRKNGNEFSLVDSHRIGEMYSHEGKLRQCIINLLGNAAKFTRQGRIELALDLEVEGNHSFAVIKVSDTGIGMTEPQLSRIFEPFYQAEVSGSRHFGGTGLGLTLTKQYCEMLGGTISVSSVLNEGTTFTMKVPTRLTAPLSSLG